LLAVIGYNDDPVEPGRGSAIFLHVARADYGPTEGCVALALPDLQALLRVCRPGDRIVIGLPR
jgi:L,D-peptidoglycan transpeptidase YkuD (ErfK/YbiS/YcfS/YnhG family)